MFAAKCPPPAQTAMILDHTHVYKTRQPPDLDTWLGVPFVTSHHTWPSAAGHEHTHSHTNTRSISCTHKQSFILHPSAEVCWEPKFQTPANTVSQFSVLRRELALVPVKHRHHRGRLLLVDSTALLPGSDTGAAVHVFAYREPGGKGKDKRKLQLGANFRAKRV